MRKVFLLWQVLVVLAVAASPVLDSAQAGSAPAAAPSNSPKLTDALKAALGVQQLQSWYDQQTGLYRTTGWWNSANAITVLADYSRATKSRQFDPVFQNTFAAAQKTGPGFLNKFYDDEGWWALAWIDVYDLTRKKQYHDMAESIFEDMSKGWDDTCSGGIWWSKDRKYKNAIANELFLSVAAHLAARAWSGAERADYLRWAQREWQWFAQSGMINADSLINDGLDDHCANNHGTTWTYNQGVVLGGLAALYLQVHDPAMLAKAGSIAVGALSSRALTDKNGILHDVCEPKCGGDGTQFKGIFVRNLRLLNEVAPSVRYRDFVHANALSIWKGTEAPEYGIGEKWSAPYGPANASTQSSGEDALVAAVFMK
jgi:predicted alpha-1,6-mannanase (GH76 family)